MYLWAGCKALTNVKVRTQAIVCISYWTRFAFGRNPDEAEVNPGESVPRRVHKHGGWEHNMWTGTSREHLVSKQWRWPQLPLLLCANYLSPISINSVQGDCLVNILLTALIKPAAKHSPRTALPLSRTHVSSGGTNWEGVRRRHTQIQSRPLI